MSDSGTPLTPIEILTLSALGDRPRYGYELVERIEELSAGRVSVRPGNLYRVLHRLEAQGLVEETASPFEGPDDDRRQYFGATAQGKAVAARQLRMYAHILERTPELKRALGDA